MDFTIKKIHKSYGKKSILEDVSFSFNQGEVIGLIGENGAGKTTLFKILSGLEGIDSGSLSPALISAKKSMHFQNFKETLLPWFTVERNISLPLTVDGNKDYKNNERIDQALLELKKNGISKNDYPYQLSGGQQQMISLARSFLNSPEIVLLDEPFSNLDYYNRSRWIEFIKNSQTTTLLISHDIRDILELCHKIYRIEKTQIAEVLNKEELLTSNA